jgi:hypothetical protein
MTPRRRYVFNWSVMLLAWNDEIYCHSFQLTEPQLVNNLWPMPALVVLNLLVMRSFKPPPADWSADGKTD